MTMVDSPSSLPPDVRRDESGQLVRNRYQFKGFVTEDGETFEEHDIIPHPCVIGGEFDSEQDLQRKREDAIRARADFWHPRLGWLRNGVKREKEWPENEGADVILRERRRSPVRATEAAPAAAPAGKGK